MVLFSCGVIFCSVTQTALAAIIMVNLLGMFKQFRDIPTLWRTSKIELVSLSNQTQHQKCYIKKGESNLISVQFSFMVFPIFR